MQSTAEKIISVSLIVGGVLFGVVALTVGPMTPNGPLPFVLLGVICLGVGLIMRIVRMDGSRGKAKKKSERRMAQERNIATELKRMRSSRNPLDRFEAMTHDAGQFDLSRLTLAGWLAGLASAFVGIGISAAVFVFFAERNEEKDAADLVAKGMAPVGLALCFATFLGIRAALTQMGIPLMRPRRKK